jgi:hypothetical protein
LEVFGQYKQKRAEPDDKGDEQGHIIPDAEEYAHERIMLDVAAEQSKWLDVLLFITPEPEYMRVDVDACTVFIDLVPAGEAFDMEMAVMYEDRRLHWLVADLHQQTSNVLLDTLIVEELLREYARGFKAKEERVRQFSESKKLVARP